MYIVNFMLMSVFADKLFIEATIIIVPLFEASLGMDM